MYSIATVEMWSYTKIIVDIYQQVPLYFLSTYFAWIQILDRDGGIQIVLSLLNRVRKAFLLEHWHGKSNGTNIQRKEGQGKANHAHLL
jgi:hypothetical protein